jgi:hypothetical protein
MDEPERYAEVMAALPLREDRWAVERIRASVDATDESDARFRQLVRDVLAGYDLAVARRRAGAAE